MPNKHWRDFEVGFCCARLEIGFFFLRSGQLSLVLVVGYPRTDRSNIYSRPLFFSARKFTANKVLKIFCRLSLFLFVIKPEILGAFNHVGITRNFRGFNDVVVRVVFLG